jgi:hypothetical protein
MVDILGGVLLLLLYILVISAPLLLVIWFVRTLARIRRDQATAVRILASIEAELRTARAVRERWDSQK